MGRTKKREPMKMRAFMMTDFEYGRFRRNIDWLSENQGVNLDMAKVVRDLVTEFNKDIENKIVNQVIGYKE